ncbi:hypothetical protein SDJN03_21088, partial [Cucurbita argyrosperma subsp. sororia]
MRNPPSRGEAKIKVSLSKLPTTWDGWLFIQSGQLLGGCSCDSDSVRGFFVWSYWTRKLVRLLWRCMITPVFN